MTQQRTLAVTAGTALLGPELAPIPEAVVVVQGRKIVAAGPKEEITVPTDADVVEVQNGTIVPGFIDSHVHIGFADPAEVLRRGVTTVRDLAWPRELIYPLARASRAPGFDGPMILTAGPMLTVEGGYPITAAWAPKGTGLPVSSPDDARRAVAELVAEGVDVVKIALNPPAGNVLDRPTVAAIADEAHAAGLRVTAHIYGVAELDKALDAGVDELAHMLLSADRLADETIARMIEGNIAVVPTLSIFPLRGLDVAVGNVRRFFDGGGRVLYGTDLGNAGPRPGIDPLEVDRMERAGLSAVDIVRSATVAAAEWAGLVDKGVLVPGRDADIVCLEGAVQNASDLTRVTRVIREGRLVA